MRRRAVSLGGAIPAMLIIGFMDIGMAATASGARRTDCRIILDDPLPPPWMAAVVVVLLLAALAVVAVRRRRR